MISKILTAFPYNAYNNILNQNFNNYIKKTKISHHAISSTQINFNNLLNQIQIKTWNKLFELVRNKNNTFQNIFLLDKFTPVSIPLDYFALSYKSLSINKFLELNKNLTFFTGFLY
jgi:hypothetical protein